MNETLDKDRHLQIPAPPGADQLEVKCRELQTAYRALRAWHDTAEAHIQSPFLLIDANTVANAIEFLKQEVPQAEKMIRDMVDEAAVAPDSTGQASSTAVLRDIVDRVNTDDLRDQKRYWRVRIARIQNTLALLGSDTSEILIFKESLEPDSHSFFPIYIGITNTGSVVCFRDADRIGKYIEEQEAPGFDKKPTPLWFMLAESLINAWEISAPKLNIRPSGNRPGPFREIHPEDFKSLALAAIDAIKQQITPLGITLDAPPDGSGKKL